MKSFKKLLDGQQLIPVVVLENEAQALGLSQSLLEGGVNVIEITLRNEYGLQAVQAVKKAFPQMLTLAGTVNTARSMLQVTDAGADGIISPGITTSLLKTAVENDIPYLPGVATASELLLAMEYGLSEVKLFPATVVGGIGALKALGGPFPHVQFCPTGGVNESNYQDFLALQNVMCVGGSWLCPTKDIRSENWAKITKLCRAAAVVPS